MSSATTSFRTRPTSAGERRISVVLVLLYSAVALIAVPWASMPGLVDPRVPAIAGAAILVVDLCTALLLGTWYRTSGRPALLALTAVYLYGGIMAALHVATFPGALFAEPLLGTDQTVGWLYLGWRGIMALGYLAAVAVEAAGTHNAPTSKRMTRLVLACLLAIGLASVVTLIAMNPRGLESVVDSRWTAANRWISVASIALCGAALALIWLKRAFNDALYLWLALVLIAAMADLGLAIAGGARYTVGWHLARLSFVLSSFLLLAYAIGALSLERPRGVHASIAAYGGAIAAVLGAVLLRLLCEPWLDESVPYVTLPAAVAVAVWLGGFGPAIVAATLGHFMVDGLFVEPAGATPQASAILQLVLFTISAALIIVLGEGMRRARDLYRRSEDELRNRAVQLQRADTNKSQFLAMLSHELRNPLAPLRNGLAILRLRPDSQPDKTLGMMERQIGQLTRLIDDLLDVSRIDRGKLEFRKERIALDTIARAAIETAMPSIEAKRHELVVKYSRDVLHVDGDAVRLTQVVANLLNNAAKFTPAGGRIELAMQEQGGHAVLSVKDNGVGIEAEDLSDVFEMFVQLEASRDAAAGGLGLGLTLVRSIVALHGGRVEARSAGQGKGAEFVVTLPLAAEAEAADAPAQVVVTQPRHGACRRALVVDDNADAARTLAELLRLEGHVVELAYGGRDALEAAERLRPEIAFIDLNMPDIDGCEVARRLRAAPWGRAIELVAMTGMGQKSDVARTRAAGFEAHLTKPADPERIAKLAAGLRETNVVPFTG